MKKLVIFSVIIFAVSVHAQTVVSMNPTFYVFNNGKDTIHLKKLDLGRMMNLSSVALVDSVQIDDVGAKELILLRKGTGFTDEHGGTFDISESKSMEQFEIWNADTKTLLFEAVSSWSYDYNIFRVQPLDPRFAKKQGKGSEKYKYDFIVTSSGNVIIDNFCGATNSKPDHAVGAYYYAEGKYTLKTYEPAKN
jgi:hypothetical protein